MSDTWCLPLRAVTRDDLATAGGKGANLGALVRAGFAVPHGFVVTTDAYRAAVGGLAAPDRDAVEQAEMPAAVRDSILDAARLLDAGRVAVRSSATAEDLPGAAFAGQQDTFLGVDGRDDEALLDAVRRCWGSLWTERAIAYRARLGVDEQTVAIAVVVQRMVPADLAGVMFTADPVTGRRERIVIDSSPGLGEAVVSGLVTPDHAVLGPDDAVVTRSAGRAETVIRQSEAGGTETVTVETPARLTDAQLRRLAREGRRIRAVFGFPQDIEWALVGEEISILQARPMTALPPAPIRLTRRQRITGPVILELVPRRPWPMEVSAWITPNVGPHVEGLVDGIIGARFSLADVLPTIDGVVDQFVPPNPVPTPRVPRRLIRTIGRLGRDPRAWAEDPRRQEFRDAVAALGARDLTAASWDELLALPAQAGQLTEIMTALRVEYLPAAGGAMVRLHLLLTILGRTDLFTALILDAQTATQDANAALADLADLVHAAGLADRARDAAGTVDPAALAALVAADPAADDVRHALAAFDERFGHRETASVLLPRDPTWGQSPETVMALVAVLLDRGAEAAPDHDRAAQALAALLRHPVIRRLRAHKRVRHLMRTASAAVTVREDTHFELTRTMPIVRRAIGELGRRLADAGTIPDADDVWLLTLDDLRARTRPSGTEPSDTGPSDTGPSDRADALAEVLERRRAAFTALAASPLIAPTTLYPRLEGEAIDGALTSGVGGGGGTATGVVRVIRGPEEFATLRAGEVLVCPATNPAWTPLFARAAAVVVDNGGLASHAAIVAREYGIAAVMGTGTGTDVLTTGTRVVVDGDRGAVFAADDDDA